MGSEKTHNVSWRNFRTFLEFKIFTIFRINDSLSYEKVHGDRSARGFAVGFEEPAEHLIHRDKLKVFGLAIVDGGSEIGRKFNVENEFGLREDSSLTLEEKSGSENSAKFMRVQT